MAVRALLAFALASGFARVSSLREGGWRSGHADQAERSLFLTGIGPLSEFLKSNGQVTSGKIVEENSIAVTIAIGGLLIAIVALCFMCCSRTASPSSSGASERDPQDRTLPQQLSGLKREKTRMLLEQAMQKQKLERLMQSILELEAELQQQRMQPFDPEEAQKRADNALRATEMLTERSLLSALAYMAPLGVQGNRIYEAMDRRRKLMTERAAKLAWEEAQGLCKDMQDVFGVDEDLRNGIFTTVKGLEIPSVATLISSATAPSKLRFLLVSLQVSVALHLVYVLVDSFVLLLDRRLECGSKQGESHDLLFWWYATDLAVIATCMLINFSALMRVGRVVEEINAPPVTADDPVRAFRMLLDYYMTVGAEALERYNEFNRSYLNFIASLSIFFSVCWMFYATHLVFNTPWAHCVTAGLIILRVRVCLFLIFLLPVLVQLVCFFISSYLSSESFKLGLIATADSIDGVAAMGLPVAGIMVQSTMVSGPRDLTYMHLRRCELRKYELSLEETQANDTLKKVEASRAELDAELARLKKRKQEEAHMTDDELRAQHIAAKDAILKDAEKVFVNLSSKAEELSKSAADQVKQWEAEGRVPMQELLNSGMDMAQVQAYMEAAGKQAQDSMQRFAQDPALQQALTQLQETAQAGLGVGQARPQAEERGPVRPWRGGVVEW